ncbi:MAG: OPT family oligopeptide transporter [Candidatus Latescibacterota bacterium]|nr:MAG: OPT family oligopeptide transporter [Candidatus Latescibacterota bacterium]
MKEHSELTLRAVISGLFVGCLIGASNITIGLKIGWTFGASITAAVISFAIFRTVANSLSRPYGAKENLITATAGSSAGTMASAAGLTSSIPALELILREQGEGPLSYWRLVLWGIGIAFLGVFFAVPLRRQMIVVDKLRYPTGTAAAETIKAMYASGVEAVRKAKVLFYAALFAGAWKMLISIKPLHLGFIEDFSFNDIGLGAFGVLGLSFAVLTIGINMSPMMIGAGVLIGPKVGWSLFGGAILAWGILTPIVNSMGLIEYTGGTTIYRDALKWILWPGVACMVTAGFTSLGLQYKTIGRTFSSLRRATGGSGVGDDAGGASGGSGGAPPLPEEEDAPDPFPMKWWFVGMVLATALTAATAAIFFGIPVWMGILAVVLSLFISSISMRATGETDINPVGAMGKITQVIYGALDPGRITTNLMAAGITAAGASQSGDLMHDLKAGWMLKVSVRKQVITQLVGVVVGVLVAAGVYRLLTAAYEIPGETFAGPAVVAWHLMAKVLAEGISSLEPSALWAAVVGGLAGVAITLLHRVRRVARWLPSPVALGIAFVVPAYYSIAMWVGALLTSSYGKKHPARVEAYGPSLASGLIAGEGLMMVAIAVLLILGASWV